MCDNKTYYLFLFDQKAFDDILKPIWWAWMGYFFPKSHNENQYFGATWA